MGRKQADVWEKFERTQQQGNFLEVHVNCDPNYSNVK